MENNENKKKLYIVQGPGYDCEIFAERVDQIKDHFNRISSILNISTPSGHPISIELNIDWANPEKNDAYAGRLSKEPARYYIRMNAGLSYRLWVAASTFASEYQLLPWIDECQVNDERLIKLSKKQILAEYAYFIGSYCITLHEISHIILGHLDYINDVMKLKRLSEFPNEKNQYSPEQKRILKAFEVDADRQAGELLLVFFEQSLGINGIGGYLSFPSRLHVYDFYVHAIAMIFRLLQDLTQGQGTIHPKPNERLYTLIGSLHEYFRHHLPNEHDEIYTHAVKTCLEAGKKWLVIDSHAPWTVMQNAHNLAFADEVIMETNIRSYQHKLSV